MSKALTTTIMLDADIARAPNWIGRTKPNGTQIPAARGKAIAL